MLVIIREIIGKPNAFSAGLKDAINVKLISMMIALWENLRLGWIAMKITWK
jgi:hypothetical protein